MRNFIMLELRNLTKIYHTEAEGSLALKGISIKFPEKGFVAITGESGSGKTTLLNILSGFVSYEEGDFFVDGVDFLSLSQEDLENYRRNDIGFVFQDYHLIEHHTVLDNLIEVLLLHGINYKEAKKKSLDILKRFGLTEQKNLKARNISSGQKQKLAIARALVKEPKIVLCDEPTANLDPATGLEILAILKEYANNHLVIVSTHNYEDAQGFATHFVRIYKGVLTAYETLKEVGDIPAESEKKKKCDIFNIFNIGVKNQVPLTIGKIGFSAILTMGFIFLATLFSANIDETSTRIISHDTFNNVNQNELQIIRKDRDFIKEEDIMELSGAAHINGVQYYGLATEMNYYYRENIDYGDEITIGRQEVGPMDFVDIIEHHFVIYHNDLFAKSYEGFLKEEDLSSGALPTSYNEIAVYGDYQIGDVITTYFHDSIIQSSSFFKFDFVVSGLLKKETEEAYFSSIFLRSLDFMQSTCAAPSFRFYINFKVYNPYTTLYTDKGGTFSFTPIYNPALGPDEVQLSQTFVNEMNGFPKFDLVNYCDIFFTDKADSYYPVSLNAEPTSEDIKYSYIYVGENIFHQYIDEYQVKTSRVYVDDYSYLDDVIKTLTNKQYDCLSEYRASSGEYDPDRQTQRAVSLIVSLVLLLVGSFIYVIFGYILERSKIGADKTLHLLGGSLKDLRKTSVLQVSFIHLLGLLMGILLYAIAYYLPIAYLQDINRFLRYYHFLLIAGLIIVLAVFVYVLYVKYLHKKTKKGSVI